jgi:uncharacterized protein YfaS (alpha-2-macroglobulin family)
LIVVQVSIENQLTAPWINVVATDILPAGFEIENPRIKDLPGMEWIKDGATPVAMDISG